MEQKTIVVLAALLVTALLPELVIAAGAGMPYEGPLQTILNSITGPVARVAGAIAIVVFGLGLAFTEGGGMMRKAIGIVFGLTIAFNAVAWGLNFFGFAGGLLV